MTPIAECPSAEALRRSLDPDSAMTHWQRETIEQHVEHCKLGCKNRLEALLRGSSFIPAATLLPWAIEDEGASPPVVPGYEVYEELGRGGMGIVYKARHLALDRIVALKQIQGGARVGPDDLQRFRTEAEAVARLRHPNVVQIHDVGDCGGLPYFTLEFCPGGSLAAKLNGTPLPPHEAARLTEQLARGLQAAHGAQVIHRDLKPHNVLLTADGTPKITDFGLAKKLDTAGHQTQIGVILGTPEYMAPEQARGQSKQAGPAADIYSLGVILYECLTGRPPFRAATAVDTIFQVITDEPVPPTRLQSKVPRDLETICLKCLEKQPGQRYASAAALAEDLRRWQAGEPITARPMGRWERAWRWCRRKPALAVTGATAALAVALLLAALPLLALLYLATESAREELEVAQGKTSEALALATKNEETANRNAREAEKSAVAAGMSAKQEKAANAQAQKRLSQIEKANGLLVGLFRDVDPRLEKKGGPLLLEQLQRRLEEATAKLDGDLIGDPLTTARLQVALGQTHLSLGNIPDAIQLSQKARVTLEQLLGPDDHDTLLSMNNLAEAYRADGQLDKALPLFKQTLERRQVKLGPDHSDTLHSMNNLAAAYQNVGNLEKALPLFEQTLEKSQVQLGPDHLLTLTSMNNLAMAYRANDQLDKALPLFEQALEKFKAKFGPDHHDTLYSMNNLAAAYQHVGQRDKALPLFEQTLEKRLAKLGPDHHNTLFSMNNLADAYQASGQPNKALPLFEQTLEKRLVKLGPDHPDTLHSMNNLAQAYQAAGQRARALTLFKHTLEKRLAKLGPHHPDTLHSMTNLAQAYRLGGQLDKALVLFEQTLEKCITKLGPDHSGSLKCMNGLATAYLAAGQRAKALALFKQTLEKRLAKLGPDHPDTLHSMNNLAEAYQADGQLDKALPLLEQTLEKYKAKFGPDHPDTLNGMNNLASAYQATGQGAKALPLFKQTLEKRLAKLGPDHPDTLTSMNNLAYVYRATGQLAKALPLHEQTLEKYKAKLGPDHPDTLTTMQNLALAYRDDGQHARALPLFEQTLEKRRAKLGPDHPDTLHSMTNLALAYQAAGQLAKALLLFEQTLEKRQAKLGADHPDTFVSRHHLARAYLAAKQPAKAVSVFRGLLAVFQKRLGPDNPRFAGLLALIALDLLNHDAKESETLLRESLAIRTKKEPDAWTTFNTQAMLGASLLGQKKYAEAEPLLLQGYEGMKARAKTIPPQGQVRLTEALERLVELYERYPRPDQEARWRKELAARKKKAAPLPSK